MYVYVRIERIFKNIYKDLTRFDISLGNLTRSINYLKIRAFRMM